MAHLNHSVVPCLAIHAIAARGGHPRANTWGQTCIPPFYGAGGRQKKQTLKLLLCTLLLMCKLASAQNPIPATSAYEDHDAYSINLQNLSIVLKADFRKKSGLIPFDAFTVQTGNILLSGQSYQNSAIYMGASYTPASTLSMFPVLAAGGTKAAGIKCADGVTTTYPYVSWGVTTAEGDGHPLSAVAGSRTRM